MESGQVELHLAVLVGLAHLWEVFDELNHRVVLDNLEHNVIPVFLPQLLFFFGEFLDFGGHNEVALMLLQELDVRHHRLEGTVGTLFFGCFGL
jgi:hypothetical protein